MQISPNESMLRLTYLTIISQSDPVYADALTRLTGKKTINDLDIINLQMLGLQVNGVNAIAQLELAV